jgi:hypothetical protein
MSDPQQNQKIDRNTISDSQVQLNQAERDAPGTLVALLFGFGMGGGLTFFQHFCLRFVLARNHLAPWDYVSFLNYCAERRLLQRVGGRYRFLHRELLDHFAQSGEVR